MRAGAAAGAGASTGDRFNSKSRRKGVWSRFMARAKANAGGARVMV